MAAGWDWLSKAAELRGEGTAYALVTVTQSGGSTPREPGAKMLVLEGGEFFGTIGGGHLEELAIADALAALAENATRSVKYPLGAKTGQCCGGVVELFFESFGRGPELYLVGAGHVGQAVARVLEGTPFRVHVIDDRPEWLARLPEGVERHDCEWDEFTREARWDKRGTYVVVMTYRHDVDQAIIERVSELPARYIGLIGSESKWARFRQRLSARGVDDDRLNRVRCPIGLPIGGKSPQEIAISLAAELLGLHHRDA